MNRRQKKKLDRKLGQKSYYNYRKVKINKFIDLKYGSECRLIYIVDSKRMDLKHPIKVTLFTDVYITGTSEVSTYRRYYSVYKFSARNNTTSEEISKVAKNVNRLEK